jgi:hypothetical protein
MFCSFLLSQFCLFSLFLSYRQCFLCFSSLSFGDLSKFVYLLIISIVQLCLVKRILGLYLFFQFFVVVLFGHFCFISLFFCKLSFCLLVFPESSESCLFHVILILDLSLCHRHDFCLPLRDIFLFLFSPLDRLFSGFGLFKFVLLVLRRWSHDLCFLFSFLWGRWFDIDRLSLWCFLHLRRLFMGSNG